MTGREIILYPIHAVIAEKTIDLSRITHGRNKLEHMNQSFDDQIKEDG